MHPELKPTHPAGRRIENIRNATTHATAPSESTTNLVQQVIPGPAIFADLPLIGLVTQPDKNCNVVGIVSKHEIAHNVAGVVENPSIREELLYLNLHVKDQLLDTLIGTGSQRTLLLARRTLLLRLLSRSLDLRLFLIPNPTLWTR